MAARTIMTKLLHQDEHKEDCLKTGYCPIPLSNTAVKLSEGGNNQCFKKNPYSPFRMWHMAVMWGWVTPPSSSSAVAKTVLYTTLCHTARQGLLSQSDCCRFAVTIQAEGRNLLLQPWKQSCLMASPRCSIFHSSFDESRGRAERVSGVWACVML